MDRYRKQILFEPIGEEGQAKLARSRVAVVGVGALGSMAANLLARAGVGFLRLIDRDFVELDNLQRQVLFDEADARASSPKAVAAKEKLGAVNSEIHIEAVIEDLRARNAESLLSDVDLVLDGTDNFETRYLVNEVCVKLGKPWIYAGVVGASGMMLVVRPTDGPCLACVFPDAPAPEDAPTCDTAGVLGPAVSVVASFQVTEALKLLTGQADAVSKGLVRFDVWKGIVQESLLVASRLDCTVCRDRSFPLLEGRTGVTAVKLCGRNAVEVCREDNIVIDFEAMRRKLEPSARVEANPYLMKVALGGVEMMIFRDGRAIVKGTSDPAQAKTLYAKYVGV